MTKTNGQARTRGLKILSAGVTTLLAAALTTASAASPQGPDAKFQWRSVGPYIRGACGRHHRRALAA